MTRKVPADEERRVQQLTASYRAYRQQKRELIRLHEEIQKAIVSLEAALIESTRKPLRFLRFGENGKDRTIKQAKSTSG